MRIESHFFSLSRGSSVLSGYDCAGLCVLLFLCSQLCRRRSEWTSSHMWLACWLLWHWAMLFSCGHQINCIATGMSGQPHISARPRVRSSSLLLPFLPPPSCSPPSSRLPLLPPPSLASSSFLLLRSPSPAPLPSPPSFHTCTHAHTTTTAPAPPSYAPLAPTSIPTLTHTHTTTTTATYQQQSCVFPVCSLECGDPAVCKPWRTAWMTRFPLPSSIHPLCSRSRCLCLGQFASSPSHRLWWSEARRTS